MDIRWKDLSTEIMKINRLSSIIAFREAAVPLCVTHLRPVEIVFSVLANGYAPMNATLGLIDSVTQGQKEINRGLVKAYCAMLDFYYPDKTRTLESVEGTITDLDEVYSIVFAQIDEERIFETVLDQKASVITKILKFVGVNVKVDEIKSETKDFIDKKRKEFGAIKNQ